MTENADKLSEVKPSAAPIDAEIAAWQTLPREEQLRRLSEKLEHADCSAVSTATMSDILTGLQSKAARWY